MLAVFDIDGTLVDSRATILSATRTAARAMGLAEPDYEFVRGGVGLSLTEAMARLAPDLGPEDVDRYTDHYKAAFVAMHAEPGFEEPLYPGAMDLLADLKRRGWRLSLATGQSRRGVARNLARAGWTELFLSSHCAEDGPGKPDPAMLNAAMAACGARGEQTVMIGDTGHDMRMARNAGVQAQGVAWGFHTEAEQVEAGAHHVAATFDDLARQLDAFAARQRETT